jgi:hypothetical protein
MFTVEAQNMCSFTFMACCLDAGKTSSLLMRVYTKVSGLSQY